PSTMQSDLTRFSTAGWREFETLTDRENVVSPSIQVESPLDFFIAGPTVCWGWIEYEDIFGRVWKQGWKHRLNLTKDSAGNWPNPFPGCYSASYKPWEIEKYISATIKTRL